MFKASFLTFLSLVKIYSKKMSSLIDFVFQVKGTPLGDDAFVK